MFCATGCDHVVNRAASRPYATYVKPICSVQKDETKIEFRKFKQNGKRSASSSQDTKLADRDIDDRTIKAATLRFCCTDQAGRDYTQAAAKRIGLELSICKPLS
uniref:Uncharacterized protein n=2 Tax=Kalmanozyma brasiliensis (strain GHG001) TaxID=1365824 RepID=V5EJH5_KALBG